MTVIIIWIIGYCFTSAYEEGRRIFKSLFWQCVVLSVAWPIRLGELFNEDFAKKKEVLTADE